VTFSVKFITQYLRSKGKKFKENDSLEMLLCMSELAGGDGRRLSSKTAFL
jgi:hypothetical protein